MTRTVFLVPRRADYGPRDEIWAWCRARWQQLYPGIPVYEGHHDRGPFNRSAAINLAAEIADRDGPWDMAIVIDSDVFLRASQVNAALERAAATGRVTWAHRRWRGIREDWTKRIVADLRDFGPEVDRDDMDILVERTNPISWSCCIVIPRPVWDDLGGFDERFEGWGFEDMAFQSIVTALYGHERIAGDVYHLWHPRSEERIVKGQPATTASVEYVRNARIGRRYMVAARRDYGLHDRPDPSDAAELERDIANLVRDDAKLDLSARRLGLPDWSEWWPTLKELRDGAKAFRAERHRPTVTMVVTTGGDEAHWQERSEYLRRSLASLVERVRGPIVQRVVYSDWGAHRDELQAIAAEHGFYVAGEGHHGYTGARRRLWAYLKKRALGSHVFATEDDFVYDRDVDLEPMLATLEANPELRQLALLRGPYYPRELEAGGVLGTLKTPHELVNHLREHPFVRHRDHFTANPSLFARSLVDVPWPDTKSSERVFGDNVLRDPSAAFAYWGAGEPWVSHIGAVRADLPGAAR